MGARVRRLAPEEGSPSSSPGITARELFSAAVIFLLATIVLSHPLAFHPASLSRLDNGDARLNAWAISWVAHQLVHDPLRLFEANTFHPLPHSLAYSEHLAVHGALAIPLLALTDDLVLTTNLLLLFSMFASAFGMYWLARVLTGSHLASLLAGIFFSFATFRFNRLPHIQMQLYAFLPLFLAAWHRFLETRRRSHALQAGGVFVLQALAGTYLGAIAAVALAAAIATLAPFARLSRADVGHVLLSLSLAAAALAPFAAPYLWVHRELGIEWGVEGVRSLSATPSSYLASSSHLYRSLTEHLFRDSPPTDYLFPGVTLLALGTVGIFVLLRERGRRPLLLCYLTILVLGIVLSLGPRTPVFPFLYEHVVFFRGLRALTRFGLLPLLSLSVLAAIALAWLFDERRGLHRRGLVAFGIAFFFAAESTAVPYRLAPFRDEPPPVYLWLAEAKRGPFVELPFKVIDTQYMFWARHHGFRPTLNGDSGFVPTSHQWMKVALGRFPSPDAIALLRRTGVRYVILHLGALREGALLRILRGIDEQRGALVPVRDFGRDLVFEVVPEGDSEIPRAALVPLEAASGDDGRLFDGDTDVVVRSAEPVYEVELEIGGEEDAKLSGLRLHYGPAPRVPAERVEIAAEVEGGYVPRFITPSDWPAVTELVEGLLETPRDGTQTLTFAPIPGARFRLRLHGIDGEPPELTEIEALGFPGAAAPSGPPVPTEDREANDGMETEASVQMDGGRVAPAHH